MGILRRERRRQDLVFHSNITVTLVPVPVDTRTASSSGTPRRVVPRRPRRCRRRPLSLRIAWRPRLQLRLRLGLALLLSLLVLVFWPRAIMRGPDAR